jgi:serine/threonine-protein kinase
MSDTLPETGGTQAWDFESQIDEVCDLFEAAWKAGGRPRIEDYLKDSPAPARVALLRELIPLDMEYRKGAGDTVSEDDYRERFPSWSRDESALGPGSTIPLQAGLYCVESEIGTGGMGEVYRVQDSDLNRSLAVKVLRKEHRGKADLEARFLEEAQILGQLQHPGIVPVHDVGRLDDGRPFFVMKLVKGQTLDELLKQRPRPDHDLQRFLAIFEQICQTMANAHAYGVIHRDLKPSNVMVGAFGEVQVMDWGLAKVLSEPVSGGRQPADDRASLVQTVRTQEPAQASQPGAILGTYAYMPPEQARGEVDRLDERSDVFGLGGILCVILTGQPPYTGSTGEKLKRQAQDGDVADAEARLGRCGADAELVKLTNVCLTADREARPRNAGVVAERVAGYQVAVRERLHQAELARAAAAAREEEARATAAQERRSAKAERRARRLTAGLAGAFLLVVVVVGSGAWWLQQRQITADGDTARALGEVGVLVEQAKRAPLGDASKYRQALTTARNAEQIARSGGASAEMHKQATDMVADLEREVEAAERDRRLLAALLDVLGPREVPNDLRDYEGLMMKLAEPSGEEQFVAAFREWGLDVDATPVAESAERLKERPPAVVIEIVAALDEWASERRLRGRPRIELQRLADLATALDDDPIAERRELRAIMARGNLAIERAISQISRTLLPLSGLADVVPGEDRNRLREIAKRTDASTAPVLSLMTLTRALLVAGEDARAEMLLRRAVQARPQEVVLRYALGNLLEKQQPPKWKDAVQCYEAARAVRPELGASLARALVNSGEVEEGLALFERLVAERSENPAFHFARATALLQLSENKQMYDKGELDEAIREYRTTIDLYPKYDKAHHNLGLALHRKRQLDEAIREYRTAIDLNPRFALAHNHLGIALKGKGQLDEAIREYRTAIDLDSGLAAAHGNLGNALRTKGQLDEAIREHRITIDLNPKDAKPHYNLGIALHHKKQLDESIREHRIAIDLDPKDAKSHYGLGLALYDKNQLDEAIREYRTAIDLDPKEASYHDSLGLALYEKKQLDEAIREHRIAIDLDPKDVKSHHNLGLALYEKKQLDEAIREYRTAIDLDPKEPKSHYGLGAALYDKKQLDEAIREYRIAIDLDPKDAKPHYNLGIALNDKKQHDEAIREYGTAIDLDPKYAKPHYSLGIALYDKKQLDEAIRELRTAIDLDPRYAKAFYALGRTLYEKGQVDEAIRDYRTAIDLDPKDPRPHFSLGIALYEKKHLDEAILEYHMAIDVDPRFAAAHNSLGIALKDKKQLDEAIREFRIAIDLDPNLAVVHLNLAGALHAKGQLDEAIREFRTATDINPKLVLAHGALGETLLQVGRFTEARQSLRRCLDQLQRDDPLHALVTRELDQCEQLLALDQKLAAILEDKAKPANDADLLVVAQFCQQPYKKHFATSCRFYSEAFDHDAKLADDMQKQHRYNAACAAALAGCGHGKDADSLDDKDRPRLRKQALDWLRADLALWTKQAESRKAEDRAMVVQILKHWQEDADLAGIRDKAAVEKLSDDEQVTCRKLWADVEAVLKVAHEKEK